MPSTNNTSGPPCYSRYTDPEIFPAFGGDECDPAPYSWDRRSTVDTPKVAGPRGAQVRAGLNIFAHARLSVSQIVGTGVNHRQRNFFVRTPRPNRIVICALETYSKIGGLQNFNRRVFRNLALRSLEGKEGSALAVLSGDHSVVLPVIEGLEFSAPKNQPLFLATAFWMSLFRASALIICHINLLPLAFAVRLFRRRLPIVLFIHGCEVWNTHGPRKIRFYETWLIGSLTRIASVSRFTAERMEREFHVAPDKFRFLPNAVDRLKGAAAASAPEPLTILTVARLGFGERQKNVHEMIAAVAAVRRRLPGVKYEIIGDGELKPELQALAEKLGVSDCVRFFGQVDDRELCEAYARAAVFAMPSDKEGFGIVYLEAWQQAKPVICSTRGAASEIVADGVDGFAVDPTDINLLADRIYVLLTQPDMARAMGESGRQKVEQKYLNANFRQHLDKILDELLADSVQPDPAGDPCRVVKPHAPAPSRARRNTVTTA